MARFAAWMAVGMLIVSCGKLFRRGAPPELVQVLNLEAKFPAPERAEFRVVLQIDNGNGHAGAITGIQWELWLKGHFFAEGTQMLARPLPPGVSEISVLLPAVFRVTGPKSGPAPLEVAVRGALSVQIEGDPLRLPFQRSLTVTAEGAPVLAPGVEDD